MLARSDTVAGQPVALTKRSRVKAKRKKHLAETGTPPTQPSADAKSGTGRLERRQAGRPAYLNVYVGCIGKTASRHE